MAGLLPRRLAQIHAVVLLSATCGWATPSAPEAVRSTPTVQDDLAFAAIAKAVDPYAIQTDFLMADALLESLNILKRSWDGKPTSQEEMIDAMHAAAYLKGVYQGFMIGVAVENFRQKGKEFPMGAPICGGSEIKLEALVHVALNELSKFPANKLHERTASNIIVPGFLRAHLFDNCLKP